MFQHLPLSASPRGLVTMPADGSGLKSWQATAVDTAGPPIGAQPPFEAEGPPAIQFCSSVPLCLCGKGLPDIRDTRCHFRFAPVRWPPYNWPMLLPTLLKNGGPMMWLLLVLSGVAVAVFIERLLYCHRSQINSSEFLNGVRTVLKRDNVVEALSICDATPGPVARLVRTAIVNREKGKEGIREALEDAGLVEVPRLEAKLNLLATVAQISPLLGLLGTVLGFIAMFMQLQQAGVYANIGQLATGIWQALISAGAGIAVAIPTHAAYNYLVSRVNAIVLDMERSATEIVNILSDTPGPKSP